jgi:hypothetical protein
MTHREPEQDRPALWVRRSRSRPYEIAVLLICVVIVVSLGLRRKVEREAAAPPPAEAGWPQR